MSKKPMIVALAGKAGSGKTTASEAFEKTGFKKLSFAKPLKNLVKILNPLLDEKTRVQDALAKLGERATKEAYPEYRRLLQIFGNEASKSVFGKDVWVDLLIGSIEDGEAYIIDDMRFAVEAEALRKLGAVMIWIDRDATQEGCLACDCLHASEKGEARKYCHFEIRNDSPDAASFRESMMPFAATLKRSFASHSG